MTKQIVGFAQPFVSSVHAHVTAGMNGNVQAGEGHEPRAPEYSSPWWHRYISANHYPCPLAPATG
jgi:hypothetical protein